MSRYKEAVLLVDCPFCQAKVGQRCRTPKGRTFWYPHSARERIVRDVFYAGYFDGLEDALEYPTMARRTLKMIREQEAKR